MVRLRRHSLEISLGHSAAIIGATTSKSVTGKTPAPKDANWGNSNSGPWCRDIGPVNPSKQKQNMAAHVTSPCAHNPTVMHCTVLSGKRRSATSEARHTPASKTAMNHEWSEATRVMAGIKSRTSSNEFRPYSERKAGGTSQAISTQTNENVTAEAMSKKLAIRVVIAERSST